MPNTIDRRTFLTHSAATAGGVAMAGTVVDALLDGVAGATVGIGTGNPVRGGTLTVGTASDAPNAKTFCGSLGKLDQAGFLVGNAVFDTLFLTGTNGTSIEPCLGLTITPSNNYQTWTVTLRQGVTFHDGSPFNADVVVANVISAQCNLTVGSALSGILAGSGTNPIGCTKVDDYTVTYNMVTPFFNWPHALSESQIAFMAGLAQLGTGTSSGGYQGGGYSGAGPIGTGPFKYHSWSVGSQSEWVANTNYWRKDASGNKLPYLAQVNYKTQADPATRLSELEAGTINIGVWGDGQSIKKIQSGVNSKGKKCVYISTQSQASIYSPAMNMLLCNTTGLNSGRQMGYQQVNTYGTWKVTSTLSPIADVRIRKALALTINRAGYLSGVDANIGAVSNGIFPTGSPYYQNPNYPAYVNNASITAAKGLVAAYKASNHLATNAHITIHVQTIKGSTTSTDQFDYVAQCAAKAGITLVAVPLVQSVLIGNAINRDYELSQWTQFGGVNPDLNIVWWDSAVLENGNFAPGFADFGGFYPGWTTGTWTGDYPGGVNFANNIDPLIETAMITALGATTTSAQIAQWRQVNDRFAIDIPYLWLDESVGVVAAQATVQNWAGAKAAGNTSAAVNSTTAVLNPIGGVFGVAQIWL